MLWTLMAYLLTTTTLHPWYLITLADVPLSPAAQRIRAHVSGMKGSFLPQL